MPLLPSRCFASASNCEVVVWQLGFGGREYPGVVRVVCTLFSLVESTGTPPMQGSPQFSLTPPPSLPFAESRGFGARASDMYVPKK